MDINGHKLHPLEGNVVEVAIDHMIEHLTDILAGDGPNDDYDAEDREIISDRLDAARNLKVILTMEPAKMFCASMETTHYSFNAFGSTEEEARTAMEKVWKKHCDYCRKHGSYDDDFEFPTIDDWGVNMLEVIEGGFYRDYQPMEVD